MPSLGMLASSEDQGTSSFGMDALFGSSASFLRRAIDTSAAQAPGIVPVSPSRNHESDVSLSLDTKSTWTIDKTEEAYKAATAQEALEHVNQMVERLDQDAWMYEKPRTAAPPRERRKHNPAQEGLPIGQEIQSWLSQNPPPGFEGTKHEQS